MKEKDLIEKLSLKIKDIKKTSNKFDSTDITSEEWDLVAELKCRTSHYQTILIEKVKYDALMSSDKTNKRFIVSTPLGIYSWDIETVKMEYPEFRMELMPVTTEFGDKGEKVLKPVNYLNINYAKKLY